MQELTDQEYQTLKNILDFKIKNLKRILKSTSNQYYTNRTKPVVTDLQNILKKLKP